MADPIIRVTNLSKSYTILHEGKERYTALRDVMAQKAKKIFSFPKSLRSGAITTKEEFWALKDVNFEIELGDRVGIIGRNGAGKSTLLKILSRITEPTSGTIKMKGRVASLLEVGTGFHPELTGRENVYLNGAILGMSRAEIKKHFDAIIDFAEIEKFLDTPVKRYSSGMYVRLAFAVAAHLEPEILVVDEVLAVGDAQFQKKCLGKMEDVSKNEGRTVLFVSHNMATVKTLCNKGIVLQNGEIKLIADATSCVSYYLSGGNSESQNVNYFEHVGVDGVFNLEKIYLNNKLKTTASPLLENEIIELHSIIDLKSNEPGRYHITYHLYNELGEPMFSFSNPEQSNLKTGRNHVVVCFPPRFFQSGTFYLHFYVIKDKKEALWIEKDIISFCVINSERELGSYMGREPGFIRPEFEWKNEPI